MELTNSHVEPYLVVPLTKAKPQAEISKGISPPCSVSPQFLWFFNQQCKQILKISKQLNVMVAQNRLLLGHLRNRPGIVQEIFSNKPKDEKQKEGYSTNIATTTQNQSCVDFASEKKKKCVLLKGTQKSINEDSSSEQYVPEDMEDSQSLRKGNQSKNISKNYGKAIIHFLRKNEQYVRFVLEHFCFDFDEFMRDLTKARKKVNTIQHLRSLWIDKQNKFAKVYRIFSMEYLRKHSLSYIFNSRVENFHRHIKFRYKIMDSVKTPETFTCMKEY